jgi:hypothetical protein
VHLRRQPDVAKLLEDAAVDREQADERRPGSAAEHDLE